MCTVYNSIHEIDDTRHCNYYYIAQIHKYMNVKDCATRGGKDESDKFQRCVTEWRRNC